jgi:aquaporin Z
MTTRKYVAEAIGTFWLKGPALFVGGWALAQLWLFWVAPLIGGAIGGYAYRWLSEEPSAPVTGSDRTVR